MGLFIILLITEVLTFNVIRQRFYDKSWMSFYFIILVNSSLSIWLWILWFRTMSYGGIFDQSDNIWSVMNLNGMLAAVVMPRIIMICFHYLGVLRKKKTTGGYHRVLTNTGFIISGVIFAVLASGSQIGRFNFRTEYSEVRIKGLKPDLDGLKIVQISDIHLPSFYHHSNKLQDVMKQINTIQPDILINTGDFITIGWHEFDSADSILSVAKGKYGEFAVLGNHDFGTYNPYFSEAEKTNNVQLMGRFISESGYGLLNDEFTTVRIGNSRIAIIGLKTRGSFRHIEYGDLNKATEGLYGVDFKILLAHDPNQWNKEISGKTDIGLTLSGHTHGMQLGIMTKRIKWSPASLFYPCWNGLYKNGNQYLYVNRGLGVIGMPFRIGMPPEITVITLRSDPA